MADSATTASAAPAETVRTEVAFPAFNSRGVTAIYNFQMARFFRTLGESIATPVITSGLYFVVFGGAMGRVMPQLIPGVDYGSFIVPGVIMLSILTNSIFNASFGIYFPKFTGTIYEVLSAPMSPDRDGDRLRRRGRDQIGDPRSRHPGDSLCLPAVAAWVRYQRARRHHQARSSAGDAGLPRTRLVRLQPVRLHHRRMGTELRAAQLHSDAGGYAADHARRVVLSAQQPARHLACACR